MKNKNYRYLYLALMLFAFSGCASNSNIMPQITLPTINNPLLPSGEGIANANALFVAGKKREAANAYFLASNNYSSPQRERLMLQAAEIASVFQDEKLTRHYLSPITNANGFTKLNTENQNRYRLVQGQLALNDRNYQEALRILPRQVTNLPLELAKKITSKRINVAQSSGNKLALVQELVAQKQVLQSDYEVKVNHDRIWSQIRKMPTQQLKDGKGKTNHRALREWLNLGLLSRLPRTNAGNEANYQNSIKNWMSYNPNHTAMHIAKALLKKPNAVVTPYLGGVKPAK